MVNLHLIIGSTGAGKSTYARTLATRHSGVRFAIDEWMLELFEPDRPEDAGRESPQHPGDRPHHACGT
jgi:predicted kinase